MDLTVAVAQGLPADDGGACDAPVAERRAISAERTLGSRFTTWKSSLVGRIMKGLPAAMAGIGDGVGVGDGRPAGGASAGPELGTAGGSAALAIGVVGTAGCVV